MKTNELIDVLKEQSKYLGMFLEIAKNQQHAVLSNNIQLLEESIHNEEKIISKINGHELKVRHAINSLAEENNVALNTVSLEELIKQLKDDKKKDVRSLLNMQFEIRSVVKEVVKINNQNRFLIEHSRNFIREVVTTLVNNKKSVLDRKV